MASRIQQLNDAFRTSLSPDLGRIVMTSGVAGLDAETIALILDAVGTYDRFDESVDPHGEHDMGRFTVCGQDYYWKIGYYDRSLEFHSADPANPSVTIRVLTIMRVDEY
jgi:hypothetical protein